MEKLSVILVLVVCLLLASCGQPPVIVRGQVIGIESVDQGVYYHVSFKITKITDLAEEEQCCLWEEVIQTTFLPEDADKLELNQTYTLTCRWNNGFTINDDSCMLKDDR